MVEAILITKIASLFNDEKIQIRQDMHELLCYCAFQYHADSKIQSSTDKCVFRYRQANVNRLLPVFDCCRARGDQMVVQSPENEQSSALVVSWEDPPNT